MQQIALMLNDNLWFFINGAICHTASLMRTNRRGGSGRSVARFPIPSAGGRRCRDLSEHSDAAKWANAPGRYARGELAPFLVLSGAVVSAAIALAPKAA
jgi:hypothetical protein